MAALCVSEPLPPKLPSSMYFLALSQAPPLHAPVVVLQGGSSDQRKTLA